LDVPQFIHDDAVIPLTKLTANSTSGEANRVAVSEESLGILHDLANMEANGVVDTGGVVGANKEWPGQATI